MQRTGDSEPSMELLFHRIYEMADLMASIVDVYGAFEEMDWDSPR